MSQKSRHTQKLTCTKDTKVNLYLQTAAVRLEDGGVVMVLMMSMLNYVRRMVTHQQQLCVCVQKALELMSLVPKRCNDMMNLGRLQGYEVHPSVYLSVCGQAVNCRRTWLNFTGDFFLKLLE